MVFTTRRNQILSTCTAPTSEAFTGEKLRTNGQILRSEEAPRYYSASTYIYRPSSRWPVVSWYPNVSNPCYAFTFDINAPELILHSVDPNSEA
ncbi:hypothetical protein M758_11G029300 [Ceratodon purpureus]|uniref:Uncharacterized protein n=1 Tax=Ceratodon purpureus TaxID=3225 RepID=A0A8T0GAR5_CERPU|nr:hypothetical protein KC19_11G030900 [Ceratodon purpureus]KAG0600383.1 hypothetical protein M758_11G029300 [Ceratodon purpureus]